MPTLRLRVVVYEEDGCWVAHSLEMDVIGVGNTHAAAIEELKGNIEAQLSFAASKEMNPLRSAPPEIQALWDDENLSALGLGSGRPRHSVQRRTSMLEWSKTQVSRLPRGKYQYA